MRRPENWNPRRAEIRGQPAERVPALLRLCAPASSYVNGVVVGVDGGHGLDAGCPRNRRLVGG